MLEVSVSLELVSGFEAAYLRHFASRSVKVGSYYFYTFMMWWCCDCLIIVIFWAIVFIESCQLMYLLEFSCVNIVLY